MKTLIFFFTIISFAFFGQNQKVIADHYKNCKFNVVIFSKDYKSFKNGDSFSPSRENVEEAEKMLRSDLKKLNKEMTNQSSSPIIHKKLKKYNRQYFGFVDHKGHKILYINALWKRKNKTNSWLKRYIKMNDGGSYFWQIYYDLTTKKLYGLNVNGYS